MDKEKKLIRLGLLMIFEIAYNLQKQLGYVIRIVIITGIFLT